jgi:protein-S-isoprenylcysteine O-methyltransferase Ste14
MAITEACILACWLLFVAYWVYWGVKGWSAKPVAERQNWRAYWAYRIPIVLGGALLVGGPGARSLAVRLIPPAAAAGYLGAALCTLGLAGAIWARQTLAANWSSEVVFRQGHELIEKGPYRLARHPIYTGLLLMCLGSAVAVGRLSSALGFVLLVAGFWTKLRQEEALLTRHFPTAYPAYKARVKGLVPLVL